MKIWKIGLIGTGYWSEKHLKAWSRIPQVDIVALCDKNREIMMTKAAKYRVATEQCYDSLEEMLRHADVDIVDIVTGPETHLEMVSKIAAAGKHILCQKPFAPSLEEAERMVDAAAQAGVRLMITENWRWLSRFQTIKSVLDQGVLGKIHFARYTHSDLYTPRMALDQALPQPFFRNMPKLLFYEMGVHWFDVWRFLFGMPQRLFAEMARVSPYIEGEDSGIVIMGYETFYGMMDMSWATRRELEHPLPDRVLPDHVEKFVVDGAYGTLKMHEDGTIVLIRDGGNFREQVLEGRPLDHDESHYRLSSHFIRQLEHHSPFETGGTDNLLTLKLVFAAYRSAREHAPVTF